MGASSGLTKQTLTGLVVMYLSTGAQAVLQLLVQAVLARLLAPADFGLVSAALVVVGFSTIFSQTGIGPAIVQRGELEERHVRTGFTMACCSGLLLTGIIYVTAPVVAGFFKIPELVRVLHVMSCIFTIQGISIVAEALLQRELKFSLLSATEFASYAIGYGLVGMVLAKMGFGVWALVGGQLGQSVIKSAVLLAYKRHNVSPLVDPKACSDLMRFGVGFSAARIANFVAVQGDNVVVGRWLGPGALGLYGRAYQLMAMPANLFGQVLDKVLFPAMAKIQGNSQRLEVAYRRGVALVAIVMLPVSVVLCVLAPELVTVLLGPKWMDVVLPLRILAAGTLFRTSYKISDSVARATGAVYQRAWRQGVYALLVLAGAGFGLKWGVLGVAWGVLMSIVVNFVLMAELSLKLTGMNIGDFWRAHVPAINLAGIAGSLAGFLAIWARLNRIPSWIILFGIPLIIVFTALWLWKRWPSTFLGKDGSWILRTSESLLPRRVQTLMTRILPNGQE